MYVNDLEHEFQSKGGEGIDIGILKIFLLLYADDITIFASSAEELQTNLNMLSEYWSRNKLILIISKTKIMVLDVEASFPEIWNFITIILNYQLWVRSRI